MSKKKMRKIILSFLSFFIAIILRLYFKTLRVTFHMPEETRKALTNPSKGFVIMVWHDALCLLPQLKFLSENRNTSILISNSRDGDLPSYVTEQFRGCHALRVKASARHMATKEALDFLKNKQGIFLTPDGPRGPRHIVKRGTCFLAQKTNSPLFAFGWQGTSTKKLSTWDQFRIPLPFSRIHAQLIGPIEPNEQAATHAMEQAEQVSLNCF